MPGKAGHLFGLLMVVTPLWILSYYSVVGGWSLDYFLQACQLEFIRATPSEVSGSFARFIAHPWVPVVCHLAFLAVTLGVVVSGVKGGIERFCKWSIPTLFILIVLIAVYSLTLPGAMKGVEYLVKPDFSKACSSRTPWARSPAWWATPSIRTRIPRSTGAAPCT